MNSLIFCNAKRSMSSSLEKIMYACVCIIIETINNVSRKEKFIIAKMPISPYIFYIVKLFFVLVTMIAIATMQKCMDHFPVLYTTQWSPGQYPRYSTTEWLSVVKHSARSLSQPPSSFNSLEKITRARDGRHKAVVAPRCAFILWRYGFSILNRHVQYWKHV